MPKLNEIIKDRDAKKFIKKSYRPWDLTGDGEQSPDLTTENLSTSNDPISSIKEIIHPTKVESIVFPIKESNQKDNDIDNNSGIIKETIRQQPDNIKISIKQQIDNSEVSTQETIRQQLDISLDPTNLYNQVIKLSGIQKNIINFVVDICSLRNILETGPIETATIATCIKATTGVVKISIKRLIDKGFIIRNKGKQAKGGYINLSVKEDIYNTIIQEREKNNRISNPSEFINAIRYQLDNNVAYNSSNIIKNTTTKKTDQIPEEWANIDFESLNHIGFTKTQIKQLIEKNDPVLVQESIHHFSFGLEYNQKIQKYDDPLNVLMGVLRKGQGWFEKDYRSAKEIAQEKLLQFKKAEMERKRELEENAYKLACSDWEQKLNSVDKENILSKTKVTGDVSPATVRLSRYFRTNIWPSIQQEYLV